MEVREKNKKGSLARKTRSAKQKKPELNPRQSFVRRRLRALEEAALNMGMSKADAEYYAGAALKIELDQAFPNNTLTGG